MSLNTLASRLQYLGGNQLERIKKEKLDSLRWALKNDYHTRMIKTPLHSVWPALINEDNLKPDYDRKIVSVEYNSFWYWIILDPVASKPARFNQYGVNPKALAQDAIAIEIR